MTQQLKLTQIDVGEAPLAHQGTARHALGRILAARRSGRLRLENDVCDLWENASIAAKDAAVSRAALEHLFRMPSVVAALRRAGHVVDLARIAGAEEFGARGDEGGERGDRSLSDRAERALLAEIDRRHQTPTTLQTAALCVLAVAAVASNREAMVREAGLLADLAVSASLHVAEFVVWCGVGGAAHAASVWRCVASLVA